MSAHCFGFVLLTLAGMACTTTRATVLETIPATDLGRSFFVRQTVVAQVGGETRRFQTALESRCGELRLVGLTAFGIRLFSAVRRGEEIEIESIGGGPPPFPPEHMLRDIERTFFRSQPPQAESVGRSETIEGDVTRGGELIHETWDGDRLVSRAIRPQNNPDADAIVIRYLGETGVDGVPERVELSNPGFGYFLTIDNFQAKEIQCPSVGP
jgi:hypothetical protein